MKLTDKCKVDFEKWFSIDLENETNLTAKQVEFCRKDKIDMFYRLYNSMKYGVYVDFFDSVENKTKVRILPRVSRGFDCYFTELKECLQLHDTRPEARTKAIEKANEIYNSEHI